MSTRTRLRIPFALCFLVIIIGCLVLSRLLPGLPERIPAVMDAPPIEIATEIAPSVDRSATAPITVENHSEPTPPDPEPLPPTSPDQGSMRFFPELENDELRERLADIAEAGHRPLSYRKAREAMYWTIDNSDDAVTTVYALRPTPLESGQWPRQQDLNCEHLWPQSKGARGMPMKTDLIHLRPAVPRVNSIRSNHPFGEPVKEDDPSTPWHIGSDEHGKTVFQPPLELRGDISRSMFYFSVRYREEIDPRQETILRSWHRIDPVDERERIRADKIESFQGNRNPFVDNPGSVDRINDF